MIERLFENDLRKAIRENNSSKIYKTLNNISNSYLIDGIILTKKK